MMRKSSCKPAAMRALCTYIKAGQQIVGFAQWKQLLDLGGRDLVNINPAFAVECRDALVLFQAVLVRRELDEADAFPPSCQTRFLLQARVHRLAAQYFKP